MPAQTTGRVLMIAPLSFGVNPQTADSNAFQSDAGGKGLARMARREALDAAARLRAAGIDVLLFDDTEQPATPDAVYCNNWFSTHADGTAVLYPMAAPNRRGERRPALLRKAAAARGLVLSALHDLSDLERDGEFLESTGSLVLDRRERVAYAAWSPRTSRLAAAKLAGMIGFELCGFDTAGPAGRPVYHANVMLSIGERFALLCSASILSSGRDEVRARLVASGREIIEITPTQMACFAGNLLQLDGRYGPVIALSTSALDALDADQRERLAGHGRLVAADIPTIERGGGSLRCMLGEIFLPRSRPAGHPTADRISP
jgi:hypothetical protein